MFHEARQHCSEKTGRIDQGIQTEADESETSQENEPDSPNTSIDTHLSDTMMPEESNMEIEYSSPAQIMEAAKGKSKRGRPPKANRVSLERILEKKRKKRGRPRKLRRLIEKVKIGRGRPLTVKRRECLPLAEEENDTELIEVTQGRRSQPARSCKKH